MTLAQLFHVPKWFLARLRLLPAAGRFLLWLFLVLIFILSQSSSTNISYAHRIPVLDKSGFNSYPLHSLILSLRSPCLHSLEHFCRSPLDSKEPDYAIASIRNSSTKSFQSFSSLQNASENSSEYSPGLSAASGRHWCPRCPQSLCLPTRTYRTCLPSEVCH